ncbi:MAG: glycoside hydrolase family 15 protein [Pseudobdellovibrionaceae bacterium]
MESLVKIPSQTHCVFGLGFVLVSFFSQLSWAENPNLEKWLSFQAKESLIRMKRNISPAGAAPGIILASPSKVDPDYYFHWVRDSALVIDSLFTLPESEKSYVESSFQDFVFLSEKLQNTPALTGLGEPRFNVDGTPYMGEWARPQNDGPALRALSLLRGLEKLSLKPEIRQKISAILKKDLSFILTHFAQPSFDLWEEVKGDHFYTRLVQLAALEKALAQFDESWSLKKADCENVIRLLRQSLNGHWMPEAQSFAVTLNRLEGAESYKKTELDLAVVLGSLHSGLKSGDFSLRDDRVLATASQLELVFQKIYRLNADSLASPATVVPAIGRYSDDVYFGGNPWYLATAAFAELHDRLAHSLGEDSRFQITSFNLPFFRSALATSSEDLKQLKAGIRLEQNPKLLRKIREALQKRGDLFFERLQRHTPADGGMAEQFGRDQGQPVSARDLTWSYAAFLTALQARQLSNQHPSFTNQ